MNAAETVAKQKRIVRTKQTDLAVGFLSDGSHDPEDVERFARELVQIKADNTIGVIEAIDRGLPYRSLERLQTQTGLEMDKVASTIGISPRTLARRKITKKLSAAESDRLLSLSRIFSLALSLFEGSREKAIRWLANENRALGGASPLMMARTEAGSREVEDLMGRLEHGVFI